MFCFAFLLCLAERADGQLERDVRVVPVDQQQIHGGQLEIGKALIEHLGERIRHQVALPHLGADEHVARA